MSVGTRTDQRSKQRDQAEDHGERIVVQISRLQPPQYARAALDKIGRAVNQQAVDQATIAATCKEIAERDSATGKTLDPQRVETVFVF